MSMLTALALTSCSTLSCDPTLTVTTNGFDPLAEKVVGQELWFQYPGMACEF